MSDVISKAILCGLGLASLTKDAIQKTAEDLVNQSKLSEEEGRKLVKDLQRRSTQAQKALEVRIESTVHKVLKKLEFGTAAGTGAKKAKKRTAKAQKSHGTAKSRGK